jgi:hypothetical protein
MNEKHSRSLRPDIEREYRARRLIQDEIDIDRFLSKYNLDSVERQRLARRLKMWEERFDGFEDYYNSIDFDLVFEEIMGEVEKRSKTLWAEAIDILMAAGKVVDLDVGALWEPITSGVLSVSEDIITNIEQGETYRLTSGPIEGTEVELGPDNRLIIRLNRPVPEGSELQLVDRDGNQVGLPVIHELDRMGSAIYDLSEASDLPPFEIKLVMPEE